jgi:hypothetical protein
MLKGVINHAAATAGSMLAGYAARAFVAVPFIIGFGFATAALTWLLIDRFGHRDAYLIIAAIFALVGVVAALIVSGKESRNEKPTAVATGPTLQPIDTIHRRSMAIGTFVIISLLVGAALSVALGPFAPTLSTPYFIG